MNYEVIGLLHNSFGLSRRDIVEIYTPYSKKDSQQICFLYDDKLAVLRDEDKSFESFNMNHIHKTLNKGRIKAY